jgi:hypothetical protein
MLFSILRLLHLATRDRPTPAIRLIPNTRYIATLDMTKVRPQLTHEADVRNWLMQAGFSPTAKPNVWKADEKFLARLPAGSILKAEKF